MTRKQKKEYSILFKPTTRREIDKRFADPELLGYKIFCRICKELPIDCKCEDKWLRLKSFKVRLSYARGSVCLGYGNDDMRKLIDRFGI